MTGSVDDPLLEDRLPACVGVKGAAVGMPAEHPAVLHPCLQSVVVFALACAMI